MLNKQKMTKSQVCWLGKLYNNNNNNNNNNK